MAFRMYYRGVEPDPSFPAPDPPKEIVVPASKPKTGGDTGFYLAMHGSDANGESNLDKGDFSWPVQEVEPAEERRQILHEVRDHLDLLKQFEGVIGEEALKKRKRDLFAALPSAPPSLTARGKIRRDEITLGAAAAAAASPKKARANEDGLGAV